MRIKSKNRDTSLSKRLISEKPYGVYLRFFDDETVEFEIGQILFPTLNSTFADMRI